jgi:hypothetical protein
MRIQTGGIQATFGLFDPSIGNQKYVMCMVGYTVTIISCFFCFFSSYFSPLSIHHTSSPPVAHQYDVRQVTMVDKWSIDGIAVRNSSLMQGKIEK